MATAAKREVGLRAALAPRGLDALATVSTPLILVEFMRPGLVNRILLNMAATGAFVDGDPNARWLEATPDLLLAGGIDVLGWTTWNWAERDPGTPTDIAVTMGGSAQWWRFTFSLFEESEGSCLLAHASPIDDLMALKRQSDEAARVYPELLKEVEEMGGFGHYAYWPGERRGMWTDGISRIWTVPAATTEREFETTLAAVHPQDLNPTARVEERNTVARDSRDVRIVRTDGELRYIRSIGHRHVNADGKVERVVRVDKDVTDLHRAEEELRLAREAASDASRAKDAFLHLMNHSLRTPLNAILGFGEAMRDQIYGPLSPDYVQCIDAVNDSASRLLELVHDILDLTRLESGHYSLAKSVCDLSEVVAYAVDLMAPRVTERNLALAAQSDPHVEVWGEERGLRQILVNLLEYATVAGREKHTVTVGARAGEPGEVILWLRDDGEGLLPELEEALKNPLAAPVNPAEPSGASGWFGLALVKSFLDLHHGQIQSQRLEDGRLQIDVTLPR
ncbi:MAG TPA: histidine kinase dimerization/phospho-acceptor domain-containing protein [Alphaproteobacteria bacterium]|nr:histidine kinase dimerization/phospho-acceptor domain-containing protein [Alphaproteobacteria bacterium]